MDYLLSTALGALLASIFAPLNNTVLFGQIFLQLLDH